MDDFDRFWAVGRRRRYLGPTCQRALPGPNSPVGSPTAFRFGRSRKAEVLVKAERLVRTDGEPHKAQLANQRIALNPR